MSEFKTGDPVKGESMKKIVLLCTVLWMVLSVDGASAQSAPTGENTKTRNLAATGRTMRPAKRAKQSAKKIRHYKPKPMQ